MKKFGLYGLWLLVMLGIGIVLWKFFPGPTDEKSVQLDVLEFTSTESVLNEPIQPIPLAVKLDRRKVVLGNRLFHDPALSKDNTISCASCHDLSKAGVDRLPRSPGVNDVLGDTNSPTVFNSVFNLKQFWDGRADTLEDQVDGPTQNPKEMASSWPEIIGKLNQDAFYVSAFNKIYGSGVTSENIKNAIAIFERSLLTPNSRFDQYLRGDQKAITDEEKQGYRTFKNLGCIVCHQGVNVGGNMFQTMGKFGNYFEDRGNIAKADYGRFNVTGNEKDRFKFKVPSLRNVAITPPYFHDGSVETLEEAIQTMAQYQLGRDLSSKEAKAILMYLRTLSGEYEGQPLAGPAAV